MLKITGLNRAVAKTKKQRDRLEAGAADFVRRSVRTVLRDLVLNAPQWSGDTAASWRVKLNYVELNDAPSKFYMDDYDDDWDSPLNGIQFKGYQAAWKEALALNAEAIKAIKWNAKVEIVNVSWKADAIQEGDFKLRPGNYIPGDTMALMTVAMKHKVMTNSIGSAASYDPV